MSLDRRVGGGDVHRDDGEVDARPEASSQRRNGSGDAESSASPRGSARQGSLSADRKRSDKEEEAGRVKKRWARRAPWECVLVAALAGGVYLNSLHGEFVFDDLIAVVDNKDVQPETPLSDVFSHDFWGQNLEDWQARPTPGAAEDPQQSPPLHVRLSRERSRVPRFVHACRRVRRAQSHKSFRPLTILSFRLSFLLAGRHWDEVPCRPTTAPAPAPAPPTASSAG